MLSITSSGHTYKQYKVVLVGDAGVGKSFVIDRLNSTSEHWQGSRLYKPTTGGHASYFTASNSCHLYLLDTSGLEEYRELTKIYLKNLDCVVFTFALNDPHSLSSLEKWNNDFLDVFLGDSSRVLKFVLGCKIDTQHEADIQPKAEDFASRIGAELSITSAITGTNVNDFFERIADKLKQHVSSTEVWVDKTDNFVAEPNSSLVDDELLPKELLMSFPDPLLLNPGDKPVTSLRVHHQYVSMTTEGDQQFQWGCHENNRTSAINNLTLVEMEQSKPDQPPERSLLKKCIETLRPTSTWQHEWLEGSGCLAATIRRQPTEIELVKDLCDVKICSEEITALQRPRGLCHALLRTKHHIIMEYGLSSFKTDVSDFVHPPQCVRGTRQISSFSMSRTHAAVATDAGKALTWGYSPQGALGIEHLASLIVPLPVEVTLEKTVLQVACGVDFTLFLCIDETVYSCGTGALGALGHGDTTDRCIPTKIETLYSIKAIGAGQHYACAIMTSGWMYAWGLSGAAKDETKFVKTPTVVKGVDNARVMSMACGAYHTVLLAEGYGWLGNLSSGVAYSWGRGGNGALGHGTLLSLARPSYVKRLYHGDKDGKDAKTVSQVAAGRAHSAFLTKDGCVYTCGSNQYGQLGYYTKETYKLLPTKVDLGLTDTGTPRSATELSCSEHCTMVRTSDDKCIMWGKFCYGTSLPNPFTVYHDDVGIIDVTTCCLSGSPPGEAVNTSCELVLGLTGEGRILLCGFVTTGMEYQLTPWLDKALIPCSITGLTRITSVGPILVGIDDQGRSHYVNLALQSWLKLPLEMYRLHPPENRGSLANFILSAIDELSANDKLPAIQFKRLSLPAHVVQVESTLTTFVFRTEVGDVFSWAPFSGDVVLLHRELDSKIIVQIACGAFHVAALTDSGELLTCGTGKHGQLGHTHMRSSDEFQTVLLSKVERFASVSCGIVSTAAQTTTGKAYFWGQLDLPRCESFYHKKALPDASNTIPDPSFLTPIMDSGGSPIGCKLDLDSGQQLAVVGKPFRCRVCGRDADSVLDKKLIFRAEAKSLQCGSSLLVKGTVTFDPASSAYMASFSFLYPNVYKVSITLDGRHVLGSPFTVQSEKGVPLSTCKLTLIGSDVSSLKSVASTLRDQCRTDDEIPGMIGTLLFPGSSYCVELWGAPPVDIDQPGTANMAALASISDGGVYVYVWDGLSCDFPRDNLEFWLHILRMQASSSHVVFLGVNIAAEHAHSLNLKPFKDINPNLRKAILVGTYRTEPEALVKEMRVVVEERLASGPEPIIWGRLATLEDKVRESREKQLEALERRAFIRLANECGIEGEAYYQDAVRHLERVGLALAVGSDHVFLVFDQRWVSHQLLQLEASCHRGMVSRESLDEPKKCFLDLLVKKNLGFFTSGNKFCFIPCLPSLPGDIWRQDVTRFTTLRHVVINKPPYHVFTAFPIMASNLARDNQKVSFGTFACVIHGENFKTCIEAGPCLIDNRKSEIRIVVQSQDKETCQMITSSTLHALTDYLSLSFPEYTTGARSLASCSNCLQSYIEMDHVREANVGAVPEVRCDSCKEKVAVAEVLSGYKESRMLPELGKVELLVGGIPGSPPGRARASPGHILRPLVQQLVENSCKQEKRLMAEMNRHFTNMTNFFLDLKTFDCPRTICLLPDFQSNTGSVIKGDILANLKRCLLLGGQKKYRLYLLCEGNGDGSGVHFLEPSQHKGYQITEVNKLLVECVGHLRSVTKLLMQLYPTIGLLSSVSAQIGMTSLFPSVETMDKILGMVGLSAAALSQVKWEKYFKEVDNFLKDFQSMSSATTQPKDLGQSFAEGLGFKVGGCNYHYLREVLHSLGKKDKFGGLVQEWREGGDVVWVCPSHSRREKSTVQVKIQGNH
ncbi:uncharacterized protein LOC5505916 [Nematostella vectensis]|nr:uncharacterized protein LOC5505916 [Nematostella vectensis]